MIVMTIDDKKDIQDALNILSEMIDKEIIDDTPIPTNFIYRPSYNKAIDDFAERLKTELLIGLNSRIPSISLEDIYKIAEEMKGRR